MEEKQERDFYIRQLVIGDIDGCIADCAHRLKYIEGENKNWDRFYGAEMANDGYIEQNGSLLQRISFDENAQLVFFTGRPKRTYEITRLWLNEHLSRVLDYWCFCRQDGDFRKSPILKAEMLKKFLDDYKDICASDMEIYLFDDDPANLKAMAKVLDSLDYKYETYCVGTKRI